MEAGYSEIMAFKAEVFKGLNNRLDPSMYIGIALLVVFVILSTLYQLLDSYRFRNSGARFTLNDGQALCARVLRLEAIQGYAGGGCKFGSSK